MCSFVSVLFRRSCQDPVERYDKTLSRSWREIRWHPRKILKGRHKICNRKIAFFQIESFHILTGSWSKSNEKLLRILMNPIFNLVRILKNHGYTFLSGFWDSCRKSCFKTNTKTVQDPNKSWLKTCQDPEKPWLHAFFRILAFPQEKTAILCRILTKSA